VSLVSLAGIVGCGSGGSLAPSGPIIPPEVASCKTPVARQAGPATTSSFAGSTFKGKVLAGSVPVIGASVQLYAAGSTGNGSTATALGSPIVTDTTGAFSVTTAYTCPFNLSLLYLVARGGKAGASGATNPGTVLMTALGACNSINGNPSFTVDEATTVASAYAFAQFLSAGGNIGASVTNFSGLTLAAGSEANLVNVSTGTAPGANFPTTGTAPSLILNALANVLNACIVSTGASSGACSQFYAAATVASSAPSNTLDAALNVARHPASNVATIFGLNSASTAFTPALAAAPSDLTMFASYTGGGMAAPSGLGIDSAGNVRVGNYFNVISLFTNTGTPSIANGVLNYSSESYGLAVDQNDNSWLPNEQTTGGLNNDNGTMTVVTSAGQQASGPQGFFAGGVNFPVAVAIDTSATSWIVDYGNSHVTLMSNSGVSLSGASGYTSNLFAFPVAVAVDSKCYGFIANQATDTITRIAPDGSDFESFVTGGGASGVAVDGADNIWVANYYDNSVGLLSSSAKVVSSGYTGGGINHPQGIAVDGAGNVWVANYRGPSITELAGATATQPGAALSPAAGFGHDASLLEAFAIAIDAAGNVWVTNFGNNTLTEFVGLAAPVRTPLLGPVSLP
jgi:streptogramin lyase